MAKRIGNYIEPLGHSHSNLRKPRWEKQEDKAKELYG